MLGFAGALGLQGVRETPISLFRADGGFAYFLGANLARCPLSGCTSSEVITTVRGFLLKVL